MGFMIQSTGDHRVPVNKLLPCGAITPKAGMAMVLTGGLLAAASGTTKPTHICMEEHETAVAYGTLIHAVQVEPDITFGVPLSVKGDSLSIGHKVTIAADGLAVTATTENGVAQIEKICGTGVDDLVHVRFV
jgi:hypothetical protein